MLLAAWISWAGVWEWALAVCIWVLLCWFLGGLGGVGWLGGHVGVSEKTRFAGYSRPSRGNSFRGEICFVGNLVSQWNSLCRKTYFAVNHTSTDIFILVGKQVTFNKKLVKWYHFAIFPKATIQTAIYSKWGNL